MNCGVFLPLNSLIEILPIRKNVFPIPISNNPLIILDKFPKDITEIGFSKSDEKFAFITSPLNCVNEINLALFIANLGSELPIPKVDNDSIDSAVFKFTAFRFIIDEISRVFLKFLLESRYSFIFFSMCFINYIFLSLIYVKPAAILCPPPRSKRLDSFASKIAFPKSKSSADLADPTKVFSSFLVAKSTGRLNLSFILFAGIPTISLCQLLDLRKMNCFFIISGVIRLSASSNICFSSCCLLEFS